MGAAGRIGLAVLAAGLFAMALPPFDLGLLGWVALVPLAFAVCGLRARQAAALGALFGLVAAHAVFAWLFRFEKFHVHHGLVLALYLGLYPALFAPVLARWAFDARGLVLVPAAVAVAEWARGHAGFLAVPWASFGQTQHGNTALVQLASVGGEPLVGIVVVAGTVALAQLLARAPRRAPLAALAAVAVAHVVGAARLASAEDGRSVTLAAVQPAILPGERDEQHQALHFERLDSLSRRAAEASPDLIVWPETAVGDIESDIATTLAIRDVVDAVRAPIVFGSSHVEKLDPQAPAQNAAPRSFNSAYVMEPDEPVSAPYQKVRLLPFAEYRPIDLPRWIAPKMFETERGERRVILQTAGLRIEPLICWESLFADDLRTTATEEPTVIAHLVNDAWFGPTSQPELHDLVSVFRAAESGRPLVLSSNTGPSWIIDARGRVVARTTRTFEPDVVSATVRMPGGLTVYRRLGDLAWELPLLLAVLSVMIRPLRDALSHPSRRPRRVPRRALRDGRVLAQEARP